MPVVELPDHVELDAPSKKVRELSAETQLDQPPSKGESFVHGLTDPFYGMAQIGAHMPQEGDLLSPNAGQADPTLERGVDTTVQKRESDYQARRKAAGQTGIDWWRGGGELTSGIAMTAPLGVVAPEAAGASLIGRIGTAAGMGALGGAVTGATEPVTTKDGFAKEKLEQIGIGAATGGALGGGLGAVGHALVSDNAAKVDSYIKDIFTRVVKPGVSGKTSSASGLSGYLDQARTAIVDVVENKPNLRYTDAAGREIAGQLPRSVEQATEAIEQTKGRIFQEYDAKAQRTQAAITGQTTPVAKFNQEFDAASKAAAAASNDVAVAQRAVLTASAQQTRGAGNVYSTAVANQAKRDAEAQFKKATAALEKANAAKKTAQEKLGKVWVDTDPVVRKLKALARDARSDDRPGVAQTKIAHINEWVANLQKRGGYSPSEAQDMIQKLNADLKNFYKNPSKEAAASARTDVNVEVASQLRSGLDDAIASADGPGYQELKNRYGALKAIESDMVKAALRVAKHEPGGGILGRVADPISWAEMLHGVWTMDPATFATGLSLRGVKNFAKWMRDPNVAVRRMFEAAEKMRTPPPSVSSAQALMGAMPIIGGAGSEAALGLTQP